MAKDIWATSRDTLRGMRRKRVLGAFFALACAILAFFTIYSGRPESTPVGLAASRETDDWIERVHTQAEAGYWLVIRGTHIGDQVVAAGSAADLTHAAIYDAEHDVVIEAVGSGVLETPLRELLAQAHRLLIIRPREYSSEAGLAAVARARSHLGFSYDWLGTLGAQSDRRFYCTELAVDAWQAREHGWMPEGVIHPTQMPDFGEVLFDSGPRRDTGAVARISDELRARFARRVENARGVDYAARVTETLWRGGVPDAEGVRWLKERGVRTVLSLRHFHGADESTFVRAAGLRYEQIRLASTDEPEPAQVRRFFEIIQDPEAQPVYVHCLHGVDRTGAMIALYRMELEGWSQSDALAEMEFFGAHGILRELRRYVGAYHVTGDFRGE
jgi:protein tyrosine phosphatase (PTP) superfamily phosphohydrolase (DUF442 family)